MIIKWKLSTFLSANIAKRPKYFSIICCLYIFRLRWICEYCKLHLGNETIVLLKKNLKYIYMHSPVESWAFLVFTSATMICLQVRSIILSTISSVAASPPEKFLYILRTIIRCIDHESSINCCKDYCEVSWMISWQIFSPSIVTRNTEWQFRNLNFKRQMLVKFLKFSIHC